MYRIILLLLFPVFVSAADTDLKTQLEPKFSQIEPQLISWRRDIHEHPELSNREFRTAKLVAKHLRKLGMEVTTGIAHTGVVGVLRGGKPGPVVALRADMDGLPVTEQTGLPFASKVTTEYKGNTVGVMHACGHDNHVAILMASAQLLAGVREQLPGTIKFIFQPAEEGAPEGEEGGAKLMIKEGVLDGPDKPEAIFGLHVRPRPAGNIYYRAEGILAASDPIKITLTGTQSHGSEPWNGNDPITLAAQIIMSLQTIISRHTKIVEAPAVLTIGSIHGGNRGNIIPEVVVMEGTIRTFDSDMRTDIHNRLHKIVQALSDSVGAKAEVEINPYAPVTWNEPKLMQAMLPTLQWAAGKDKVFENKPITGAEDFAWFQEKIPGMYFILGVNKPGVGDGEAPTNHSPFFDANEATLITGVRAMTGVAIDYLQQNQ